MKLSDTHGITKYSTYVMLNNVITIQKCWTTAILDFWK